MGASNSLFFAVVHTYESTCVFAQACTIVTMFLVPYKEQRQQNWSLYFMCCLAVLHNSPSVSAVQELVEEQSRRIAAQSEIASITTGRDAYRFESQVLELKLKSMQLELNNARCQMEQDQGCRGCMRQPQPLAPGIHDRAHGSDAAKVNKGQTCAVNHLGPGSSMCIVIAYCILITPGSMMDTILPGFMGNDVTHSVSVLVVSA